MGEEKRERGGGGGGGGGERELQLLSTIYGDRVVRIIWAKNESSSTQRGLRVGTGNQRFGKSKISDLGSVHRTS